MVVGRILFATLAFAFLAASPSAGASEIGDMNRLLQELRALEAAGGWPSVPKGARISPGGADPRLETLAHRLTVSRDIPDSEPLDIERYGGALQRGVLRFQERHGLDTDGIVGPATVAALNVPVSDRIRQILVNIERLEAEAPRDSSTVIRVNVPAFRAELVRAGKRVWTSRIIVGETCSQTPLFETSLESVIINPTWTVPHRIASEELLFRIQNDPGYLEARGYEVRDADGVLVDVDGVDWGSLRADRFPFTLVQKPGPRNELGRIKFMIPNAYDVYMHDTPSKHLFDRASRAYSHGCIRVADPIALAARVLEDTGWDMRRISRAVKSNKTTTIPLHEPITVSVVYRTVEIDDAGVPHFYNDIYERDADVSAAAATP